MRVCVEAKNISIEVMSERFPDFSWADAMRACNEQRATKKLNPSWNGISLRRWIVDKCSENRLVFDTGTPTTSVHHRLRWVASCYVQKRQPIKILVQHSTDNKKIENIVAHVHRKNIGQITELYKEAEETKKRYSLERHRIYGIERDLLDACNSLQKLTVQKECNDRALNKALAVLQIRLKDLDTHKQAVIGMYEKKMNDIENELSNHCPGILPGSFLPRSGGYHEPYRHLSFKREQ